MEVEYKTIRSRFPITEEVLNEMGIYGWEFVQSVSIHGDHYIAYFKREKKGE